MTRLIANQKISRRTVVCLAVPRPHLPAIKLSGLRAVDPAVTYTVVVLGAFALLFALLGATVSVGRVPRVAFAGLPRDESAEQLLSAFVRSDLGMPERGGGIGPPAGTLPAGIKPFNYTVKKGDTISEIAASFGLRIDTLISYNRIEEVRAVRAGATLLVPAFDSGEPVDGVLYNVRRGDSLSAIAARFGVELNPILDANELASEIIRPGEVLFVPGARMETIALRRALGTLFIKPVVGRLTSTFGMRIDPFTNTNRMHYGVDWANVEGTPVRASNGGVVSMVGESRTLGKYILIDHVDQYQTLYAHLSAWSVREGVRVEQGATIGRVGNTGKSTGPHLHFAIYKNYEPVDPFDYVH